MRLDHSLEAAHGALWGLYNWARRPVAGGDGELIEVSIKSPRGKWHTQHWTAEVLLSDETVKQLVWWSSQGREVYMGCVGLTSRPAHGWRRGGAALRGHAGALWIDVDCEAPGREGTEYFRNVDEAVAVVDAGLGPVLAEAAMVVGSGWGVQYWIPLYEPVPGIEASRAVRGLVGWLGEFTGKKIDRVWDVTRVMRMPGTWNWRAGPDESDGVPAGVIRWPDENRRGLGRLGLDNVIDALADQISDVLAVPRLDPELDRAAVLDSLLERYAPGAGWGESGDEAAGSAADWDSAGDILGDLDRLAHRVLGWEDVLTPHGWRCVSGSEHGPEHEQVWERPGKTDETGHGVEHGERSAVVYADKPQLLVVYSDSTSCGFSAGLRGSGRRGTVAGVGVISKWRAWVDLAWGGDEAEARRRVYAGAASAAGSGDPVLERLAGAWSAEMDWVQDWAKEREWEALLSPHVTKLVGEREP